MLVEILRESSRHHNHLCPRQVLGARMGLYAGELLGFDLPRKDKRLLVIAESDGCAVDGITAATGCRVGNRTLRVVDFGKVAATFIDIHTETSIRIAPSQTARSLALEYSSNSSTRWEAMLSAYQVIPAVDLLVFQHVQLDTALARILSMPGKKVTCEICGEEIMNEREVLKDDMILCRSCAGEGYYRMSEPCASVTSENRTA